MVGVKLKAATNIWLLLLPGLIIYAPNYAANRTLNASCSISRKKRTKELKWELPPHSITAVNFRARLSVGLSLKLHFLPIFAACTERNSKIPPGLKTILLINCLRAC